MVAKASHVIGLPIVTIAKGKELDRVQDVIYDPRQNRVKALLIDKGGWFAEAKVILIHDTTSIGEDAVMIEDQDKIKKASEVRDGVAAVAKEDNYLTQTKVIAEDGKELGKVSDIYFDTDTGDVQEFEVSQGLIKNVQSGKKKFKVSEIITVGEDATIVKGYTEEQFEKQGQRQGVQGAFNEARDKATSKETKESVDSFMDKTGRKIHEWGEQAKHTVEGIGKSPKTKNTISAVQDKAKQAEDAAVQKVEEGKQMVTDKRKKDALGQYLTVNILSPEDEIIAERGEMVTNSLLVRVEAVGLLDKVLNNTSREPLGMVEIGTFGKGKK